MVRLVIWYLLPILVVLNVVCGILAVILHRTQNVRESRKKHVRMIGAFLLILLLVTGICGILSAILVPSTVTYPPQ
ncbi:MAG: hypothetical protein IKI21_10630 [Oscillospiraceae bacterium]|nr:hypothetical protein [Oscillospiraceae bacterium]